MPKSKAAATATATTTTTVKPAAAAAAAKTAAAAASSGENGVAAAAAASAGVGTNNSGGDQPQQSQQQQPQSLPGGNGGGANTGDAEKSTLNPNGNNNNNNKTTTTTLKVPVSPNSRNSSISAAGGIPGPASSTIHLNSKWTIWYDNPRLAPAGADWKENLKPLGTFDTAESFWRMYNNLRPASQISVNSNYSVFRQGVEPAWEDPQNIEGGKFVLTIPKPKQQQQQQASPQNESKKGKNKNNNNNNNNGGNDENNMEGITKIDEYWLYTVLAVIGETMDATGDQVMGAVVSIRKSQDRIALWLKSSDQQVCVSIGERWKKVLDVETTILRYQMHKDAYESGHSFRNEIQFEV